MCQLMQLTDLPQACVNSNFFNEAVRADWGEYYPAVNGVNTTPGSRKWGPSEPINPYKDKAWGCGFEMEMVNK